MPLRQELRICLVTSSLGAGGAEKVLVGLANYWSRLGHQVTFVTFHRGASFHPLDHSVDVWHLPGTTKEKTYIRGIGQTIRCIWALRGAILECSPDIAVSFLAKVNVMTMVATWNLDVPVIVSERNNPNLQRFRWSWRLARDLSYRHADCVVVPTHGAMDWLSKKVRANARLIPIPVTPTSHVRAHGEQPKTIVAAGRLTHQKGFDLLLQAFSQIAGEFPDARLIIRGEGETRKELELLRDELSLGDRVSLPGVTPKPLQWREEGDIFVLSSRYEGFGNVLVEAMAYGMPVISFDCSWGPGEVIQHGENGLLVTPESACALADAMRRLMRDSALCDKLGTAAQLSMRRLSEKNILPMWDDVIEDVLDRRIRKT